VTRFREIVRLPEFERDMKRLQKRFRTLEDDLQVFIKAQVELYHHQRVDNKAIVQVSGLGIGSPTVKVYKAKKFACRALKHKGAASGIRVIYAYLEEEDRIELIEMYYKGDKENGDRERILGHYKT